ncbi:MULTISPECIES: aminotransferase class I/II-fold pyridoxal phosphate-dependent enzyme [Mesorhizobium]|uniref:Aminotransferase n=4 Tax=Mesorhizobium TaxID=68287 RepID=Q8KJ77_RHILI|nr:MULTISPECIES: aminotransferase class I/II-fold pyridoxal phosphate-dependent enzyme [Mesorhizobium]MBZ9909465.1 aminotransferase class I/II-fold pyridoxal phosphate-dependent enzyme [Mesorhizobium sp. BR115XR7A]QGX80709.1 aminotransferase class I/II-fold pyridoxal phosphate-dependent enzyme [Mesorhizobium japonicum R7A]QJF04857.1 aminotransferase class I/II-fold pyridoxal phosphate-dependent enzyme [Mesorhizobium japonicum R7A]QJF10926.1 aminotransferase class I/II-fold pyridoxal phosphate-d
MVGTTRAVFILDFRTPKIHLWSGSYDAPLVPISGQPLLDRLVNACSENGIEDVALVENLSSGISERFCLQDSTNTLSWRAAHHSDLIERLRDHEGDTLLIWGTPFFDSEVLDGIDTDSGLRGSAWRPDAPTGIYRLSADVLRNFLPESHGAASDVRRQTLSTLAVGLSGLEMALPADELNAGSELLDIRDGVDASIAEFRCDKENLLRRLETSVGGYWRKPIAEHMLLCNTRFPPTAFYDRLATRLEGVLTCYPSQQIDIVSVVGAMTSQQPDFIAVGNGVTDLIQALYSVLNPTIAIPTPTFAGFQTPLDDERKNNFVLAPPYFDLDVRAFLEFATATGADTAIVVNPNNPTGRLVDYADVAWLAEGLGSRGLRLIVDESFIDFPADGRSNSVENLVQSCGNLIVVKSLGKVFGLGGIRLAYLLAGDPALVAAVRRKLPLWNINGIAEYTLFLLPEFAEELEDSLRLLRKDRELLIQELQTVPGLDVVPSQTNFILCRLPENSVSAAELKRRLVLFESVLVRECGYQAMDDADRYLRLTVRSRAENERLAKTLRRTLSHSSTVSETNV